MNHTLTPSLTSCPECPQWEIACNGDAEKAAVEARHAHAKHGVPLPPQAVTGANWQEQAVDAVRQVAGRGKDFTIFEALAEFGLQSPPDHRHRLGKFATLIHDMGIAHPVSAAPSQRDGTKKSQANVWHRNPARCASTEMRCRAKAGAR